MADLWFGAVSAKYGHTISVWWPYDVFRLGVMCEMFLKSKGRTLHSKAKYAQFGIVHSVTSVHTAERGIEQ